MIMRWGAVCPRQGVTDPFVGEQSNLTQVARLAERIRYGV